MESLRKSREIGRGFLAKSSLTALTLFNSFYLMPCSAMAKSTSAPKSGGSGSSGKSMVKDLMNGKGNGAFDSATNTAKDVGGSAYVLLRNVGVAALVISIIVLGLTLALHSGNQQKTAEGKDTMVRIVIGSCFVFGAMSILAILVGIAGSI